MTDVHHEVAVKNRLGEGPLWSVKEQAFYWCDLLAYAVFKYVPTTGALERYPLDTQPGCLVLAEGGGLLLATAKGFAFYDFQTLTHLKDNIAYQPPARFNDGKLDRQGRLWAGTAPGRPEGHLYRMDAEGVVTIMESGIGISNGIGWSPDDRVMYYSDSGGAGVVWAYDFDAATGAISNRRVFLPPTEGKGVADGLTVDSEGGVWCAFWDGWRVERFAPDGRSLLTIPMPVQRPTSCMFGGADLTTLYVTSAGDGFDPAQQPLAGDVFRIETGVRGLPEPVFKRGARFSA